MDKEDLKVQVAQVVEDLFNEKEEADIRKRTEAELQKAASSISDLTTALEEKNTEVAELDEKLSEKSAEIEKLNSELEAAREELEKANEKLAESEKTLEDMMKDRAAEQRMADLEDAGVTRSDRESQTAKVREMTDEDFASYKDELVSIREAVVAELKKASEKAEADAKAEEEAAKKAAEEEAKKAKPPVEEDMKDEDKMKKGKKKVKCSEESSEEGDEAASENPDSDGAIEIEPAQITPGEAAMASLNMEIIPSNDIMAKYRKMGEAMAKMLSKKED
jgi:DNA repair exonuclease SbcCD ATPase subunit